jgi:hypothetical protein
VAIPGLARVVAELHFSVLADSHERNFIFEDVLAASADRTAEPGGERYSDQGAKFLKGLPEAIEAVCPRTEVQLCIVHLVRASLNYVR